MQASGHSGSEASSDSTAHNRMRIEPIEPGDGVPVKDREEHQATHVLLLIFLLLAAGIITAGYSYYRHFAKNNRTKVEHQLNAVAELKVGDLTRWRDERVGDADIFYKNSAFYALVRRAFENPQDLKAQGQLRSWLGPMWEQNQHQYDRVFLLDIRGLERISVPDDPEPVASILTQRAAETLRSGQVTIVDFYRNEYNQRIHLAVLVPVLGGSDGSGAIGVLALRINPERYLYPFLSRWPTPSRTAETLLVRRDGNNALFLNELKFQTNTALNLRVPLENGELPAVKAALGQEGIVEGTDYRGIPVVADVLAIPGSPWFLVARMDTAEIYAPVRERLWGVVVVIGILLFGAGAGVAFVWRGQSTRFYRERAEASEALQRVNEKLDITLMGYRSLFDGVPVGLYRTTPQGVILDANMAFVNMLGYPDRSSLLAVNINDTFVEPADRRRWQDRFEREKIVRGFKTRMLGHDGEIVWVLNNAHAAFAANGLIRYHEGSLLDITEGELADKALRESEEHFRLIAETIDDTFLMADVEFGKMFYVSPAYERVWGRPRESLYEKPRSFIEAVHAEDRERVVADLEIQKTGQPFGHEYRIVRPDGSTRWIWDRGFPVRDKTGQVTRYVGVAQDITERKRAEEALRESEARYRVLFERGADGILIADLETRGFKYANPALCRMLGYSEEEMRTLSVADIHPKDALQSVVAEFEAQVRGDKSLAPNIPCLRKDGSIVYADINATTIAVNGRACNVGFFRDVTERKRAEQQLSRERRLTGALMEHTPDHVYFKDNESRFLRVNRAMAKWLGLDEPAQAIGKTDFDFFDLEHAEKARTDELKILETGDPMVGIEEREVWPDGRVTWVSATKVPLRDQNGQIIGTFGTSRNITEHKRAEEAMRESEARYRALFEGSADGILIADLETRAFKYANPALCRMLGYSEEEMRTLSVADIHPKDALQSVVAEFEAQVRGDKSLSPNLPCLRKDGSIVYADINATTVAVDGLACLVGFFRDITERKRAEDALRESEAVLRSYFDHGGAMRGIIELMDDDILHLSDNAGSAAFFGRTKEAMQNKLETQMGVPRDSLQMWVAHYKNSQRTGAPVTFDYVHNSPEGQKFLSATVRFLEIAQSGRPRFAYLVNDITEQKRLEAEFRQAQKMEAVGVLTGGLAHDFNNLLTVINGYSDLLLRGLAQDDPRRSDLEEISLAGQRAASLTSQLLAFSRKQVVQPRILDLNDVVSDMGKMLGRLLRADIDYVALTQPGLGRVKADFGQIQQIIMNLAVNAQDAMPQGGKLTIETANVDLDEDDVGRHPEVPAGPYIMLAVRDNGIGMDAKIQARIFEPFFTTKEPGKGTGLGLSTVHVIVKQSGGFIRVNSEPGKGTTLKIYLPGMKGEADKLVGPAKEKLLLKGVETVLVVEAEPLVRTLTARILREQGYTVLEASNGAAALHTDQEFAGEIHLVLTDVVMPGMSARAFVSQIAAARPGIKVLYVSGYTDNSIVHHEVLDSDVAFLQKPFTADDLACKVREVLDSPTLGAIE